jgi:ribonuclease HI
VTRLYTDGAALRNPHGPGGWAWLAVFPDGSRRQGVGSLDRASNNQTELRAAIEGLNALPLGRVRVISDSKYVVKGMTEWVEGWRRHGSRTKERKPVKNQDRWEALLAAVERHGAVEWQWVRGHAGHPENELVNDLAESAAQGGVGS